MQKYNITKVDTDNKRGIHFRMENSDWCEIVDLRKDCPAWIRYKAKSGSVHLAHTSPVREVECHEDGGLTIYTKNTVYILEELN